jgi:hypothetical protein
MYTISFTESAADDLRWFRKGDQMTILDRIHDQLRYQPGNETKNRKRLRPNQTAE